MIKTNKLQIALLILTITVGIIPLYGQHDGSKSHENCPNYEQHHKGDIEKKVVVKMTDDDRGFLGVVTEMTDKGLEITEVAAESPAEKAGLKKGDIILTVGKKSVKCPDELIGALKGTKPNDVVTFKIKTDGKEKTLDIKLAETPKTEMQKIKIKVKGDNEKDVDIEMPMMDKEMMVKCPKCGEMMPMHECLRMTGKECDEAECCQEMKMHQKKIEKEFMVMPPAPTYGFLGVVTEQEDGELVIQDVVDDSPAEKAGLKEGDVILAVNETEIITPQQLIDILKTTKPGDVVSLRILSDDKEKTLNIKLAPRPEQKTAKMNAKMHFKMRKHKSGRGAGYFGPGFTTFKYDKLNQLFSNHNLGAIEKEQFVFSGGGWGQANRVRLGGFGMGGGKTVSNESLDVEVGYGAGFFELGYSIVNAKYLMITPMVGIGGGGLSLKITTKYNRPTTLDGFLTSPWNTARASKGGLAMYPGLAIDIPFGFVGLTFKGGYIWSPLSGAWTVENLGTIGNEPDLKLNGLFATAGIMFGGGK